MTTLNGQPIRQRGGKKHTPTFKVVHPFNRGGCTQNLVDEAAPYYQCAEGIQETVEDHIIPRSSITIKQHLMIFPPTVQESIELNGKQMEIVNGKATGKLIKVTDRKVLRMSDKTLLNQSDPFAMPKDVRRQTSVSKRIRFDPDNKVIRDKKQTHAELIIDSDI